MLLIPTECCSYNTKLKGVHTELNVVEVTRITGITKKGLLLDWCIKCVRVICMLFDLLGSTRRTDDDLDHLDPIACRYAMLFRICIVQIQRRKQIYADCAAPTRQHELDHADQESICLP